MSSTFKWAYEQFEGAVGSYMCRKCNRTWFHNSKMVLCVMFLDCPECRKPKGGDKIAKM